MRLLIVHCHPADDGFSAALRDHAIAAATRAGHEVRLIDLYRSGFDPVMSEAEWRGYHTPLDNEAPIAAHLEALRWCEGLAFVYPTWWYGPPAMLKGWLDRVWVPHATFAMPEKGKPIGRKLTNIRLLVAVSTLGSPGWFWRFVMGEPGRRIVLRGLKFLIHPRARTKWLALHEMDSVSARDRERFLADVERCFLTLS